MSRADYDQSWHAGEAATNNKRLFHISEEDGIGPFEPRQSQATQVVAIEASWFRRVKETTLYCYEFAADNFMCLDEVAGYYISYTPPVS
jgi:hypothetical protein